MNRKIIYLVLAGIGAFGVWQYTKAPDANSSAEMKKSTGAPMVSVVVPKLSTVAEEGKLLFDDKCAVCHGKDAAGVEGSGPTFMHRVYVPGHHGDGAFLIAAKNGVRQHHWRFGNMPPVEGITDEAVVKIIVYVRELQKANKIF